MAERNSYDIPSPRTISVPLPHNSDSGVNSSDYSPLSSSSCEPVPCSSKSLYSDPDTQHHLPGSDSDDEERLRRLSDSGLDQFYSQRNANTIARIAKMDSMSLLANIGVTHVDKAFNKHQAAKAIAANVTEEDVDSKVEALKAKDEAEYRKLLDTVPFDKRTTLFKENEYDLGEFKCHVIIQCPLCPLRCDDRQHFHKHFSEHLKETNKKYYMCERCENPHLAKDAQDYVAHVQRFHSHVTAAELYTHPFSHEQKNAQGKLKDVTCRYKVFKNSKSKYACPRPERPMFPSTSRKREVSESDSESDCEQHNISNFKSDPESVPETTSLGVSKTNKRRHAKDKNVTQAKIGRKVTQTKIPNPHDVPCLPDCEERQCIRLKCGKVFNTKEEFWNHAGLVHMSPKKIQHCPTGLCNFKTEYNHHMLYHINNHTATKPYKCKHCCYSAVNEGTLMSHLKSHSEDANFKCLSCGHSTKFCHSFKLHLRANEDHHEWAIYTNDGNLDVNRMKTFDIFGNTRGSKTNSNDITENELHESAANKAILTPDTENPSHNRKLIRKPKTSARKPRNKANNKAPEAQSLFPNNDITPLLNDFKNDSAALPEFCTSYPSPQNANQNFMGLQFSQHSPTNKPALQSTQPFHLPFNNITLPITPRGQALAAFYISFMSNPNVMEWVKTSTELKNDLATVTKSMTTNCLPLEHSPHVLEILNNASLWRYVLFFIDYFNLNILPHLQRSIPDASMAQSQHNSPVDSKPKVSKKRRMTPKSLSQTPCSQNTIANLSSPSGSIQSPSAFKQSPSPPNSFAPSISPPTDIFRFSPSQAKRMPGSEAFRSWPSPNSFIQSTSPKSSPSKPSDTYTPQYQNPDKIVPMDLSMHKTVDKKTVEQRPSSTLNDSVTIVRNKRKADRPHKITRGSCSPNETIPMELGPIFPQKKEPYDPRANPSPHLVNDDNNNNNNIINKSNNNSIGSINNNSKHVSDLNHNNNGIFPDKLQNNNIFKVEKGSGRENATEKCKFNPMQFPPELLFLYEAQMRLQRKENPFHCDCKAQFSNYQEYYVHSLSCS